MACSGTYCNQNCVCNGGNCLCNTNCVGGFYAPGDYTPVQGVFTGSISGNPSILTITGVTSGTIAVGDYIYDVSPPGVVGITNDTKILSFISGSGGLGTYGITLQPPPVSPGPYQPTYKVIPSQTIYVQQGPTASFNFTEDPVSSLLLIRDYHINQLRAAIDSERARRLSKYSTNPGYGAPGVPQSFTTVYPMPMPSNIKGLYWTELKTSLNNIPGYTAIPDSYSTTDLITATRLYNLREKVKSMRADCVCNSDCNSFSTCSCHSDCACHNDCGCNYSDRDLKTDIQYI